jgi:hypothetical protein
MNYLDIPNAGITGMRLFGNDVEYMQEGLTQGIIALISRFSAENGGKLIVSGCNFIPLSGNLYQIQTGWVLLDGTLAYFAGDTYTFAGAVDYSTVELELFTEDYPLPIAYRTVNSVSYTPLKRTLARLKTQSGVSTIHLGSSNRLETTMNQVLDAIPSKNQTGLVFESSFFASELYLTQKNKIAILNAKVVTASNSGIGNVFVKIATLPSEYKPKYDQVVVVSTTNGIGHILFRADRDVLFKPIFGFIQGETVYLSAISFFID